MIKIQFKEAQQVIQHGWLQECLFVIAFDFKDINKYIEASLDRENELNGTLLLKSNIKSITEVRPTDL